jgi:hypothetical protein
MYTKTESVVWYWGLPRGTFYFERYFRVMQSNIVRIIHQLCGS